MKHTELPRIVVLGGGTGTFTILSGLKRFPVALTAIVSMSDNGGSTGTLRDELGVLPPGDIRQCLVALSEGDSVLRQLFNYRFTEGSLSGHNFGNLFLSVLEKISGDSLSAVREAQRILDVRGNVVPVSAQASNLFAELRDGSIIAGEHTIDESEGGRAPIERCFLDPHVPANPEALVALQTADLIVLGPGDLYTSLVPVLLVDGIAQALATSSAPIVYVMNLVTKRGQTDGYTASEHSRAISRYIHPTRLNAVLVNNAPLPDAIAKRYEEMGEFAVQDDLLSQTAFRVYREDLITGDTATPQTSGDRLRRSLLRHDPEKLAAAVLRLLR
jgi:uncharacterized cofD-like protein